MNRRNDVETADELTEREKELQAVEEELEKAKEEYKAKVAEIERKYLFYQPDFASRVKAFAKYKRIKMTEIESTCGVSQGYFSRFFARDPQAIQVLNILHSKFGMDIYWLVTGKEQEDDEHPGDD